MLVRKLLVLAFIILCAINFYAQESFGEKFHPYIEYSVYGGKVVQHRESMNVMGDEPYFGNDLKVGLQSTGIAPWQKGNNNPAFGIGFYSGYFNNKIIGNPFASYSYFEIPFKRAENYFLSTTWGTGITFNLNEYDSISNPNNVAIATDINVYIEFCLNYKYFISDRLNLGMGLKVQHFSNGAIRHPNLGLNMASAQLVIAYLPQKRKEYVQPEGFPALFKKYELTGYYGFGWRGANQFDSDKKYLNSVVSLGLTKRLNVKRAIGAGFDLSYYPYTEEKLAEGEVITTSQMMAYSAYLSSDLIVGDFRMVVQLGTYLYRAIEFSKPVYERIALRYYLFDNAFVNVAIKAHYAKAQCIEWGIGFTF